MAAGTKKMCGICISLFGAKGGRNPYSVFETAPSRPRLRQPTDELGRLSVAIRSGPLPRPRRLRLPSNSERDCVPKRLQGCVITCTESPLWEHRQWANEFSIESEAAAVIFFSEIANLRHVQCVAFLILLSSPSALGGAVSLPDALQRPCIQKCERT